MKLQFKIMCVSTLAVLAFVLYVLVLRGRPSATPATPVPKLSLSATETDPTIHIRGFQAADMGLQQMRACNESSRPAVIECNSNIDDQGRPQSFRDVIDCVHPVAFTGCKDLVYTESRWQFVDDLVQRYAHAASLADGLKQQGVAIVLNRRSDAVDQCDTCERDRRDCFRAIIDDPRKRRIIYVPCEGEPRSEPW